MMLFKKLALSFMLLVGFNAFAQQDPQFSDYKLNISSFNPAFAGFYEGSAMLIHRTQFVGIDAAPQAINFSLNAPISEIMGLGFNIINQSLGVTEESIITGDYSYSIFTADDAMLTFGLKAGIHVLNVDYNRLNSFDQNDISFENNIEGQVSPRIGVGFLFSTLRWFVGLSTPNFLQNNYTPNVQNSTVDSKAHFYFISGFNTPISDEILFKPSILSRFVSGSPLAVDIAANFDYRNQFRFGISYRWDAAISAIAGINVTETIQVGYSYDYLTNDLSRYASGSHQFYLKFTFLKSDQLRRTCNCSFTDSSDSTLGF